MNEEIRTAYEHLQEVYDMTCRRMSEGENEGGFFVLQVRLLERVMGDMTINDAERIFRRRSA